MKLDCLNMFRQLPPNSKNCVNVIIGGKLEYGRALQDTYSGEDSNPQVPWDPSKEQKKILEKKIWSWRVLNHENEWHFL